MKSWFTHLLLICSIVFTTGVTCIDNAAALPDTTSSKKITSLPIELQLSLSQAIGLDQQRYHAKATANGYVLINDALSCRTSLEAQQVQISNDSTSVSLRLSSFGYENHLNNVSPVMPTAEANRVTYHRNGISEWYINGPLGVEQVFTLERPPFAGQTDGKQLSLILAVDGARPQIAADGTGIELLTPQGETWHYGQLSAVDVRGNQLPVSIHPQDHSIVLTVDDSDAVYPVTIDPLIQVTRLSADNSANNEEYIFMGGAIDMEDTTLVVGLPRYNVVGHSAQGMVYVFKINYLLETDLDLIARLTAADGAEDDFFGGSVSISEDIIYVGAPYHDLSGGIFALADVGAVYRFDKPAEGWSDDSQPAVYYGETANAHFGYAVDNKGTNLLVGAPGENNGKGRAYAFDNSTNPGNKQVLEANDGAGDDDYGSAVALYYNITSPSGMSWQIAVGAPEHDTGGAVYLYSFALFSPNTLNQDTTLLPANGSTDVQFGKSVALKEAIVVAGAPQQSISNIDHAGALYVFARQGVSGTNWNRYMLTAGTASPAYGRLGSSVAINDSSNVIIGGLRSADSGVGKVAVFLPPLGGWQDVTTPDAWLTMSSYQGKPGFGQAVAISGDFIAVGAPEENLGNQPDLGRIYLYHNDNPPWTSTTESVVTSYDSRSYPADDHFGESVAVNDHLVVIGAPYHNADGNPNRGAAYVYSKPPEGWSDTWSNTTQSYKLIALDGKAEDNFGMSVDVSGDTIIIGAPGCNHDKGAVYVFEKSCLFGGGTCFYIQKAKLTIAHPTGGDGLGSSVAIDGDTIVAGAPWYQAHLSVNFAGEAFVFRKPASGWVDGNELLGLYAYDAASNDFFGNTVDISGHTVIVGARYKSMTQGAAYIYVEPPSGWDIHWSDVPETAKLLPSDPRLDTQFGRAVALLGNTAAVSTPYRGYDGTFTPGIYIFEKPASGWTNTVEDKKINTPDSELDLFGGHIALSDNFLAATYRNFSGVKPGDGEYGIQTFRRRGSSWLPDDQFSVQYTKTQSGNGHRDVALYGDTLIYGAGDSNDNQLARYPDNGFSYLLKRKDPFPWELFRAAIMKGETTQ